MASDYIERMIRCKLGYPMSDPSIRGDQENEVRIGDVGYFDSKGQNWTRLFNVFEPVDSPLHKTAFCHGAPAGFTPWDKKQPAFTLRPLERIPHVIRSKDVVAKGGKVGASGSVLPAGGRVELDVRKERGAALILPESPCGESLNPMCRPYIQQAITANVRSWLLFAQTTLQQGALKESDLVFVFGLIKTSNWALASFSKHDIGGKLAFQAGVPGVADISPEVWGRWEHSFGAWILSGPQGDKQSPRLEQFAAKALTMKDHEVPTDLLEDSATQATQPSTSTSCAKKSKKKNRGKQRESEDSQGAEKTQKFLEAIKIRPNDQCIFMIRMKWRPIFHNPFIQKWFKLDAGAGPSNYLAELSDLVRDHSLGEIRWVDGLSTSTTTSDQYSSALFIEDVEYGRGYSRTQVRARADAAEKALRRLRDLMEAGTQSDSRGSQEGEYDHELLDRVAEAQEGDPSDLYDPEEIIEITDPLDILVDYLVDQHKREEEVKYVFATDDDVAAILNDENDDDDFKTIVQAAKLDTEVISGVATACLPDISAPLSEPSTVESTADDDVPPNVQPSAEDVLTWRHAMNSFTSSTGVDLQDDPLIEQFTEAIGGRGLTVEAVLWWLDKKQLSQFGTFHWAPICVKELDPVLEKLVNLKGNGADAIDLPQWPAIFVAFSMVLEATKDMAGRLEALSSLFAQMSLHLKLPDRSAPTVSNVFANVLNVLAIALKFLKDTAEETELGNGALTEAEGMQTAIESLDSDGA